MALQMVPERVNFLVKYLMCKYKKISVVEQVGLRLSMTLVKYIHIVLEMTRGRQSKRRVFVTFTRCKQFQICNQSQKERAALINVVPWIQCYVR